MTWSYSPALSTEKDQVRYLIGDTDMTDQLLSDEELAFSLTRASTLDGAAADAAQAIAAKFARMVDRTVGPLSIRYSEKQQHYELLAERLYGQRGSLLSVPTAGGISVAERDLALADEDRPRDLFDVGMHDFPGTGLLTTRREEEEA